MSDPRPERGGRDEVARKSGKRETLRGTLTRADTEPATTPERDDESARGASDRGGATVAPLGISVMPTSDAAARDLALPDDVRGLVVAGVNDASPASGRLATSANDGPDVILSVEGTPVRTTEELRNALRDRKAGEIVTLRVYNVPSKVRRVERLRLGEGR